MELLNVIKARSVWLVDIDELNPRGKAVYPEVLDWLKGKYAFAKAPSSQFDVEDNALTFLQGRFQIGDSFTAVDLRIHNDGLVADTRSSTRDTDAFLVDLFESATNEFGLSFKPEMVSARKYVSELFVRTDRDLSGLNPKLRAFSARLSALTGNGHPPFDLSGVMFSSDPPKFLPSFKFERKANTPLAKRKFYSLASLRTGDHLGLLEELERILG